MSGMPMPCVLLLLAFPHYVFPTLPGTGKKRKENVLPLQGISPESCALASARTPLSTI